MVMVKAPRGVYDHDDHDLCDNFADHDLPDNCDHDCTGYEQFIICMLVISLDNVLNCNIFINIEIKVELLHQNIV